MDRNSLVKVAFVVLSPMATIGFGRTDFERFTEYRGALAARHLEGDETKAKAIEGRLLGETDSDTELHKLLVSKADSTVSPAEVAYATGTQNQYYCRGKGLVYAEGAHADGSWSKLAFISGSRQMIGDSYSQMAEGQWIYELADSFRKPERSQLWMTYGVPSAYNIIEVRNNVDNGAESTDRGDWDASWQGDSTHLHWSANAQHIPEPVRLYMALQYQIWGSWDLGYKLDFTVGKSDHLKSHVNANGGEIQLKSDRTVAEHLPHFSYQDGEGVPYNADDCYRVAITIARDLESKR